MEGWIKLWRKLFDNDLWLCERFSKGQAWIDLLLLATHKERTVFIKGVEVNLVAGQLCWSQSNLAERWKWNRKTVSRFLDMLVKRGMIVLNSSRVTTVITITSWDSYQSDGQQNGQQNGQQSTQQAGQRVPNRTDTNKNVNNEKNDKEVYIDETSSSQYIIDASLYN